jgi:peptide/nickel transport system substrate-binding protein
MPAFDANQLYRRQAARLIGAALGVAIGATPLAAQPAKTVLVIGLDISDSVTFDPARMSQYSAPLTLHAAYDTLVTTDPGDYVTIKPLLAESYARTPDGKGWRFKLKQGIKFASGNPVTVEDVKFSFDRLLNIKDQPSQYVQDIDRVEIVDPQNVDVILKDANAPILTILCAPAASIYDSKIVKAHGGTDAKDAKETDKATQWLDQNSAGSGPYQLTGWERNQTLTLAKNANSWRGKPNFERVIIRHIGDSAAQLLAVRRGDIDAAYNLTPEQIISLKDNPDITIAKGTSLDFIYMTLNNDPAMNEALGKKEARQAVAYAIDYDGIRDSLVGGAALRNVNFIPIGVGGSTEALTKEIGYRQDLDKAKALLQKAGLPNGFTFPLSYGTASIVGVSYQLMAQKIQADLARVGIKAELQPMDQVTMRTQFIGGKTVSALTYWNPPAVETFLWAAASVERVAKRVHWEVPPDVTANVHAAAKEQDVTKQNALYRKYMETLQDQANYIMLFQPIYQVATRKSISDFTLTGAGWLAELAPVKPAK